MPSPDELDSDVGRPAYRAARLADLADWIRAADVGERWRMVVEFLKEFHHEEPVVRTALLRDRPSSAGAPHWDALLAALAEHLAVKDGQAAPSWCDGYVLPQPWFLFDTPAARGEAFADVPAAFRRRGVYVSAVELHVE